VSDRERALSFGAVADLYDSSRPRYPGALIADVIAAGGQLNPRILEVGAGTGKATRDLAARGAQLVAIEPDEAMAKVNRSTLPAGGDVTLVISTFEDLLLPPEPFDVVASAQAWHWVDPKVGFAKARRALRPGGHLAIFWNGPRRIESELRAAIDDVYEQHVPGFVGESMMGGGRVSRPPSLDPLAAPHFGAVELRTYDWETTYTTEAYVGLLRTHSDHGALPSDQLAQLLDGVGAVIDSAGGSVPFAYRSVLLLAAAAST
jgi:SAM-dependent methyltransferase